MKGLRIAFCVLVVLACMFPVCAKGQTEAQVQEVAVDETPMTHEELVAAAKEEGTVTVYSFSSRIAKAATNFEQLYGIKVEATNLKDFELIEKVGKEGSVGAEGADMVLAQDIGRVTGELINMNYLYSYVPESLKEVIPEKYQDPLVFCMINKLFIFNNEDTQVPPFDNIWAITTDTWNGKFQFKNPFQESVNANFLTMVTKPEIAEQIADAYKDYFGSEIVLTTPNAGYEWIKAFFQNNLIVTTSDTTCAENVGIKGQHKEQNAGLFVFNKLRHIEKKNLALQPMLEVQPFAGFIYPVYALMSTNAKHPAAAKLFIEYLFSEEGFSPWSIDIGTYSTNPNIAIKEGDYPLSTWEKILISEDPVWCFENRADVEEFVNEYLY